MMTLQALFWGALIGLGLFIVARELIPAAPTLSSAFDRLNSSSEPIAKAVDRDARQERFGSWIERRTPRLKIFSVPAKDLALLGRSVPQHFAKKGAWGLIGFLAPFIIGVIGIFQGDSLPIPMLVALPLGLIFFLLPDTLVLREAANAREDFGTQIGSFFELVGMAQYANLYATQATKRAALIGQSWVFLRIQEELLRSQYAGEQSWDGLANLSDEIGVPELRDFANIMRLSGEQEATVYSALRARGRSLRLAQLSDEQTKANQRTTSMNFPILVMAFSFMLLIGYPAVSKLTALQ